jgi:hypothetical protein
MSRSTKNWLESYMKYVEDTEPATVFHRWVAMSIVAAALQKKVCLSLGRLRVYPNMYVVLVADPGVARKTQAIDFGTKLLEAIPDIHTSADATSKEALLMDIEASQTDAIFPDSTVLKHSSLTIISREFESFLGQKKENTKMLVLLTDLFDCKELPWKYRTKHSGSNEIPSIYLNLLAATTPDSIASCLPSSAIGGGLTSRILFIWARRRAKKCPRPEESPAIKELERKLIDDLAHISRITGRYEFSNHAGETWDAWYHKYDEDDQNRICKDPSFAGWYSRKPMYILKLAQIIAASQSSKLVMEWEFIEEAIQLIESTEQSMSDVFRAVGRSAISSEVDTVLQIIKNKKAISEENLMSIVWKDNDNAKFDNVISTILRTGQVKREYQSPTGEKNVIWYYEKVHWEKMQAEAKARLVKAL